MSNYTFENLTQSGLMKINSKDDKNVSLSVDCFGGMTSFAVWTGAGGKPWKLNLPRKTINNILTLLKKMRRDPVPGRQPIMINAYDQEIKKWKNVGQIAFAIDEGLNFQIEVAHNDLNGRHTFPVKQDGRFDFSNTFLSEKEGLSSLISWLIEVFSHDTVIAERLTSFKRNPQGGGNRGGYNQGGNNYNNNNNGGGYQQNRQPPQSGGSFGDPVVESDLHI